MDATTNYVITPNRWQHIKAESKIHPAFIMAWWITVQGIGWHKTTTWGGTHGRGRSGKSISEGPSDTPAADAYWRPHTDVSHVPNLVLQEVHVPVQQGVGRREDAHRLHACTPLQLTLHRHVGEAGQAEEGPFPEIAKIDQMCSGAQNLSETFCFAMFCPLRCNPQDKKQLCPGSTWGSSA